VHPVKTVRLPWPAPSSERVERALLRFLDHPGELEPDPGAGGFYGAYRLDPDVLARGAALAGGSNGSVFLRRVIETARAEGLGRAAKPAQAAPSPARAGLGRSWEIPGGGVLAVPKSEAAGGSGGVPSGAARPWLPLAVLAGGVLLAYLLRAEADARRRLREEAAAQREEAWPEARPGWTWEDVELVGGRHGLAEAPSGFPGAGLARGADYRIVRRGNGFYRVVLTAAGKEKLRRYHESRRETPGNEIQFVA
jgi:hypothetical protein